LDEIINILRQSITELFTNFVDQLPEILLGLIIFFLFFAASRWVKRIVQDIIFRSGLSLSAGKALGRLAQWTTVLGGLLAGSSVAIQTFNAGELIQVLGIGSVAIGFAFRDILQNFLAGILILLTEPFKVGDQIITDKFEGTVTRIETRATMIKTYDGRLVVMPNTNLFTNSVLVNTAFPKRRTEYDIGIGYGDNIDKASELILEAIKSVPGISEDPPPDVRVWDLAASTVNIRARWWTHSQRGDVTNIKSQVLTEITNNLTENGIDMPYSTQVVLFHDQTESTDGDRHRQREGWPVDEDGDAPQPLTIANSLKLVADALKTNSTPNK
jgi:small-conductance mechanosensitive channel